MEVRRPLMAGVLGADPEGGMSDATTEPGGIQVIARAAAVLRALAAERGGMTLSRLAQEVELPRSTVQRIVGALLVEDLLMAATASGGVRLGPAITALAGEVRPGIVDVARPYLAALRDATGETVDLAEFRGDHLIFIDQHLGGHRLCAVSGVGRVFPLHNSANGKACLALLAPAQARRAALASLDGDTSRVDDVMAEVRAIGEAGLAYDWQQNAPGICAVGTAFRHGDGQIFAIAVPTPAERFDKAHEAIGREVLRTRKLLISAFA